MIIASELFQGEIVIHMKEKIVLFILVCALTISLSSCKKIVDKDDASSRTVSKGTSSALVNSKVESLISQAQSVISAVISDAIPEVSAPAVLNPNYTDINAAEQANRPDSMYHWYKELIALRKNPEYKDVVVYGEFVPYKEEQTNLMAYYRKGTDRTLLVVANYQHDAQDVVLPGTYKKVLMNNLDTLDLNGDILHMPGYQAVIFEM